MSLLREIQNSAIDANEPIATLLRKCKVLAARLGNRALKEWIEHELNGYPTISTVPEYRILSTACKGNFAGYSGRRMDNGEIPKSAITKDYRKSLFTSYVAQPVAAIESLINSSDGSVREPWPTDTTAHFGEMIYSNMSCLQAWKVIPDNELVAILDIIRNKVLNFVLEIEAEDPDAGEAPINSVPVPEEKVTQIFNTYITGSVQNVATGSTNVKQIATQNGNTEVFDKLLAALMDVSGDKQVNEKVIGAVEEMKDAQGTDSYKLYYQNFMSVLSDHMQVYGPVVAPFLVPLGDLIK